MVAYSALAAKTADLSMGQKLSILKETVPGHRILSQQLTRLMHNAAAAWLALVMCVVGSSPAAASAPMTALGLITELEEALMSDDQRALESLHAWMGVTGRFERLSRAHITRLIDLDVTSVYLESIDSAMPSGGLRYNVDPDAVATIEFTQPSGSTARLQLPFGERDGRLYLAMLIGEAASDSVATSAGDLRIAVQVADPAYSNAVSYEIACVLETDDGDRTLSYAGRGGTVRTVAGNRFKSCGLRLPHGNYPAVEMKLSEQGNLVYRSGQVVGAGTILYRPGT